MGGGLAAVVLVAGGVSVALVTSASSKVPSVPTGAHAQPAAAGCAMVIHDAHPVGPSNRAGADQVLVPGSPVSAVACTYQAAPGQPTTASGTIQATAGVLRGSMPLTGPQLQAVVHDFQQPIHSYEFRCPYIDPFDYLTIIDFQYSTGPDVTVFMSRGCPSLSNGTITGEFHQTGALPAAIAALSQ